MVKRVDNIRKRNDRQGERRYQKGRNLLSAIICGSVNGKSSFEWKEKFTETSGMQVSKSKKVICTPTFGDVLTLWMTHNKVRLKGGTVNKYQNIINTHINPDLGSIPICDISSTMINEFLDKKRKNGRIDGTGGLSSSYVRSIMLVISAALKYAAAEGLCPIQKVPIHKPNSEKKEIRVLDFAEQKKLESVLKAKITEKNAGILISLYTGLRIGEVCALSWNDVDLTNKVIHVRHTIARIPDDAPESRMKSRLVVDSPKTKASIRDIPIPSALVPLLTELRKKAVSAYVISEGSSFISPRTFEYHFQKMIKLAKIPSINFHCLRHTFATRCIEAGVDIKSLSEILGHASVGTTLNTYVHSSIEMKRNQLEKLSVLYENKAAGTGGKKAF